MAVSNRDFKTLCEFFRAEIKGLTDAQLDWDNLSEEWSEWSIRRQISHVALAYFFWVYKVWGGIIWPGDSLADPVDFSKSDVYDRRLDEEKFWRLEDLFPKFEEALMLAGRADKEKSLEEKSSLTLDRTFKKDLMMGKTNLPVYQFWSYVGTFHMAGLDQSSEDETVFTFSLAGMIRHLYWEALVHLRTIQRLKVAQGLMPAVQIPREGYLLDPFFWGPGDEPLI